MDKLIMQVHVEMVEGGGVSLDGPYGSVVMYPFSGTVEGQILNGVVSPCGVDTQVVNINGVRNMSARYMLIGKDSEGNDAKIFVQNEGWFEGDCPRPFKTVPTFVTDSPKLAEYLHRGFFRGVGSVDENGKLTISFYEISQ